MSDPERLDSWKAIATFLGWDVRTVRRWEQHRGLPVHRIPGPGRPRVFAYPHELREWLQKRDADGVDLSMAAEAAGQPDHRTDRASVPNLRRHVPAWQVAAGVAVATIALGGLVLGWTAVRRPGAPQQIAAAGNELQALDAAGRPSWTHRFEGATVTTVPIGMGFDDADGDGRRDIITTLNFERPPTKMAGELFRFSDDGRLLWAADVQDRVTFGAGEYGPPWPAVGTRTYRVGGETRIAWLVHHFTWWPGLLLTYDRHGRRLGTFVNAGWIHEAAQSPDSRYLMLGGVTNSREAYFVAALDAEHPVGHSPESQETPFECVKCPAGDPAWYVVFPRTDVGRHTSFPDGHVTVEGFENGPMQVQVPASGGPRVASTVYELSPDLRIERARFGDAFWEWHRRLEGEGKLDHAAETCPHRRGLRIESWTRAGGWQTLDVPVK